MQNMLGTMSGRKNNLSNLRFSKIPKKGSGAETQAESGSSHPFPIRPSAQNERERMHVLPGPEFAPSRCIREDNSNLKDNSANAQGVLIPFPSSKSTSYSQHGKDIPMDIYMPPTLSGKDDLESELEEGKTRETLTTRTRIVQDTFGTGVETSQSHNPPTTDVAGVPSDAHATRNSTIAREVQEGPVLLLQSDGKSSRVAYEQLVEPYSIHQAPAGSSFNATQGEPLGIGGGSFDTSPNNLSAATSEAGVTEISLQEAPLVPDKKPEPPLTRAPLARPPIWAKVSSLAILLA
jgi:hypothetical protein